MSDSHGPFKGKGETVDVVDDRLNQSDSEPSEEDSDEPKYRSEEWLRYQYLTEQKSARQIAEEYGYGSTTVNTWIEKHDIEKRDFGELISKSKRSDNPYEDRDWLHTQYHVLGLSANEIADKVGVTHTTIHRWMDKYGLDRRDGSESLAVRNRKQGPWDSESWLRSEYLDEKKSTTQIADEHGVSETLIRSRLIEHGIDRRNSGTKGEGWKSNRNYTNEKWLRDEYSTKGQFAPEIAEKCDVSEDTIYYWLDKHGIDIRSKGEAMRMVWGEKNATPVKTERGRETVTSDGNKPVIDASWQDFSDRPYQDDHAVYRSEEWLCERYWSDEMTIDEMAELANCSQTTIGNWMKKHGIETRGGGLNNE